MDPDKIFFSADWHWGHRRIREYEPCRPAGFEGMLAENHRQLLTKDSIWWLLGDLTLGTRASRDLCAEVVASLPGRKYLVRGNHDRGLTDTAFRERFGFDAVYKVARLGRFALLSHHPVISTPRNVPRLESERSKEAETSRKLFQEFERGSYLYNIHGHTHSRRSPDSRCLCVSVEQTGLAPIALSQLIPGRIWDFNPQGEEVIL